VLVEQARANYEQAVAQAAAESPNVPITVTSNQATVDTDVQQVVNDEAAIASAQRDYDSNSAKLRQAEANNRKANPIWCATRNWSTREKSPIRL
jgi:hypothetical protein